MNADDCLPLFPLSHCSTMLAWFRRLRQIQMAPRSQNHKKYEQPYSSRYVTRNIEDSARADEAPYIRNFTRFIHLVYRKQTPFQVELLPYLAGKNVTSPVPKSNSKSISDKQASAKQVPDQQNSFRTMGPGAPKEKSPTNTMTTMPSDFEHIFHYSEME